MASQSSYSSTSNNKSSSTTGSSYRQNITNHPAPTSIGQCSCQYALAAAQTENATETIEAKPFTIRLTKNAITLPIVPGSVCFSWAGNRYVDYMGALLRNPDPVTGLGAQCGSIDYLTGIVSLDVYDGGDNQLTVHSLAGRLGSQYLTEVNFRTPSAPLRPGSLTIAGITLHGKRVSAVASFDGHIRGDWIEGEVDYDTGVCTLGFGKLVPMQASYVNEDWYNPELNRNGQVWKPEPVYADSLTYACVVYSYIPLSSKILGLNPVRLPSDGRVPIVKSGDIIVIHNTEKLALDNPAPNATVQLPRKASNIEIYDSAEPPLRLPSTMYTFTENTESAQFSANADFADYTLPLQLLHKIEDMVLVSETQINGQVTLTRGVTHAYPVKNTYVSSAVMYGDLQARYTGLFDQKTWKNAFSDDLDGDVAPASYNEIDYPISVQNTSAVSERWALVFDSTEHFKIHAEQRGIIGEGYISQDCQPINEITKLPYFFIDRRGWGVGWAAGNVLRFNTVGAAASCWAVRTTLQGPATEPYDSFTILPRGDAQ